MSAEFPKLSCEAAVIEKIKIRQVLGLAKYGQTVAQSNLSTKEWLIHAQEEAMDLAIYLERLIQEQ